MCFIFHRLVIPIIFNKIKIKDVYFFMSFKFER